MRAPINRSSARGNSISGKRPPPSCGKQAVLPASKKKLQNSTEASTSKSTNSADGSSSNSNIRKKLPIAKKVIKKPDNSEDKGKTIGILKKTKVAVKDAKPVPRESGKPLKKLALLANAKQKKICGPAAKKVARLQGIEKKHRPVGRPPKNYDTTSSSGEAGQVSEDDTDTNKKSSSDSSQHKKSCPNKKFVSASLKAVTRSVTQRKFLRERTRQLPLRVLRNAKKKVVMRQRKIISKKAKSLQNRDDQRSSDSERSSSQSESTEKPIEKQTKSSDLGNQSSPNSSPGSVKSTQKTKDADTALKKPGVKKILTKNKPKNGENDESNKSEPLSDKSEKSGSTDDNSPVRTDTSIEKESIKSTKSSVGQVKSKLNTSNEKNMSSKENSADKKGKIIKKVPSKPGIKPATKKLPASPSAKSPETDIESEKEADPRTPKQEEMMGSPITPLPALGVLSPAAHSIGDESSASDELTLDLLLLRQQEWKRAQIARMQEVEDSDRSPHSDIPLAALSPIKQEDVKSPNPMLASPTGTCTSDEENLKTLKQKIKIKQESYSPERESKPDASSKKGDKVKTYTKDRVIKKEVTDDEGSSSEDKSKIDVKRKPRRLLKLRKGANIKRKRESGSGSECDQRARRMKLFGFWSGPKRHRVASLNALAKVHCLYENESRSAMMGLVGPAYKIPIKPRTKEPKESKEHKEPIPPKPVKEEPPCTRTLRYVPGSRGVGKHYDIMNANLSSSPETSSDETGNSSDSGSVSGVPSPAMRPKIVKKVIPKPSKTSAEDSPKPKVKKVVTRRKRKSGELMMDLKDMVVRKRMASLNASAILAASYSFEKRGHRTKDESSDEPIPKKTTKKPVKKPVVAVKEDKVEISSSDLEVEECGRSVIELRTTPGATNKKVAVIVNQDTDVTITGVYVNSTTRSTHHEGFCSIAGMQYRISSTSHTQTEATAVATETVLHKTTAEHPAPPTEPSPVPLKSYTPLGALSSMQPPGAPPPPPPPPLHHHPHPHHHHHHHHPPPSVRPSGASAFSAPPPAGYPPPPPPPPPQDPAYMHGYYQPAGPLISSHHAHGAPPVGGSKGAASPSPTPPPTTASESSADNDVIITASSGDVAAMPPHYPRYPAHVHHQYAYGYPQYYPSPPASAALNYSGPQHYHSQDLCYSSSSAYPPATYFHHKSYGTPPPGRYTRYGPPPPQYYPSELYPAPPSSQQQSNQPQSQASSQQGSQSSQQMVATGSAGSGSYQPPPAPPIVDSYQPPPIVDPYPPPPPGYYTGYSAGAGCYSHSPPTRSLFIDATYQPCPCPMQSCPKNVHTGPLTGEGKGPMVQNSSKPLLQPVLLALPLEPSVLGPPSPARGSAGVQPPPSPATATCPAKLEAKTDQVTQQSSPLPRDSGLLTTATLLIREQKSVLPQSPETPPKVASLLIQEACPQPSEQTSVKLETPSSEESQSESEGCPRKRLLSTSENMKSEPVVVKKLKTDDDNLLSVNSLSLDATSCSTDLPNTNTEVIANVKTLPKTNAPEENETSAKQVGRKRKSEENPSNSPVTKKVSKLVSKASKQETKSYPSRGGKAKLSLNGKICQKRTVPNGAFTNAALGKTTGKKTKLNGATISTKKVSKTKSVKEGNSSDQVKPASTKSSSVTKNAGDVTKQPPELSEPHTKKKKSLEKPNNKVTAKNQLLRRQSMRDHSPEQIIEEEKSTNKQPAKTIVRRASTGSVKKEVSLGKKASKTVTGKKTTVQRPTNPASGPSVAAAHLVKKCGPKRAYPAPKWSNGWTWEGDSFEAKVFIRSDDSPEIRKCFPAMRHKEGDIIAPFDCILLKSGKGRAELPYVAKVAALWENPEDGEMMMSLLWYYRPEHTEHGRRDDDMDDEIFASKHKDVNSVACIEDKCYVLTFNEYCRFRKAVRRIEEGVREPALVVPMNNDYPRRSRQPPVSVPTEIVFFCRRVYDFRQRRILKNPG